MSKNYKELVLDPSFQRWVKGEASSEEKVEWDQWVMENAENRARALKAQEKIAGFRLQPWGDPAADELDSADRSDRADSDAVSADKIDRTDLDQSWNQLVHRLDETPVRPIRSIRPTQSTDPTRRSEKGSFKESMPLLIRIAASFLLILTTGFLISQFYQSTSEEAMALIQEEVTTSHGEQKVVKLGDGSKITLNGNSKLSYTTRRDRPAIIDVYLSGEAFLTVTKRKRGIDLPFQLNTADGKVEVLGTEFAVSTRNGQTQVVLEEGSVSIQPFHLKTETILKPGERAVFKDQGEVKTQTVNPKIYTSWRNGRLYFEETRIEEVADQLENTFGIRVAILDKALSEQEITGSIEDADIVSITDALSIILKTPIRHSGDVIYIGRE